MAERSEKDPQRTARQDEGTAQHEYEKRDRAHDRLEKATMGARLAYYGTRTWEWFKEEFFSQSG